MRSRFIKARSRPSSVGRKTLRGTGGGILTLVGPCATSPVSVEGADSTDGEAVRVIKTITPTQIFGLTFMRGICITSTYRSLLPRLNRELSGDRAQAPWIKRMSLGDRKTMSSRSFDDERPPGPDSTSDPRQMPLSALQKHSVGRDDDRGGRHQERRPLGAQHDAEARVQDPRRDWNSEDVVA